MKKLFLALGVTFVVATSYISSEKIIATNINAENNDTAAAIIKTEIPVAKKENHLSASESLYEKLNFEGKNKLNFNIFEKAFRGFENLRKAGKIENSTKLLTVCDFSLSSNCKRLWVINTETGEILFNSLVAHGKNTGEEFATNFSNKEGSLQSSLGFYITDVTYNGENGYSLKLLGMDKGYNDNALQRAVVMHGADYVNEEFAIQHKRIGRSWGCPAVPRALAEPIINTIKGKNVLFIYYPDESYMSSSEWLKSLD